IPSQDVDEKHFVNIALSYMRNFDDQRFEATLSVFDLLNEKRAYVAPAGAFKQDEYYYDNRHVVLQLSYSF
ncbi:MAG: hypothetical protein U9N52_09840, partial [Campylobacterota bacterium]|nr:hypothetical protein [Campylobacterota bacterium]